MLPHPLVVVGGSAGGLDAASRLVGALDADLPAALAVVLHQAAGAGDYVAQRLGQTCPLPVGVAEDGAALESGRVWVAPSDRHLRFEDGVARVAYGPRVNRARPAIDVTLRSAAATRGARSVGVLLSGFLDDGTAGLDSLRRAGGAVLVQDPDDAAHADMPQNALDAVEADRVASAEALGAALGDVVRALPAQPGTPPDDVATEAWIDAMATGDIDLTEQIGTQVPLSCPDCAGPIWEIDASGPRRFRCHVGHAYSEGSMLAAQADTVEESLWVALRTLEERARMLDRMGRSSSGPVAASYGSRADETRGHAARIRTLLTARREMNGNPAAA